jgi:hypothetical protein
MDEELKRQIVALRIRLHADGVTDSQRSQALDLLKIWEDADAEADQDAEARSTQPKVKPRSKRGQRTKRWR